MGARLGAQAKASSAAAICRRSSMESSSSVAKTAWASVGRRGQVESSVASTSQASAAATSGPVAPISPSRSKAGSASCSALAPSTSRTNPSPRTSGENAARIGAPAARAVSTDAISSAVKPLASSASCPSAGQAARRPWPFRCASASAGGTPCRARPSAAGPERPRMTTPSSVSRLASGPFQGAAPRPRPPRRNPISGSS